MGQYKAGRGNALDEWLNGFGQRDVEHVDMSSTLRSWRAAKSLWWHLARPTAQQKVALRLWTAELDAEDLMKH
jgi:hypothetical protein